MHPWLSKKCAQRLLSFFAGRTCPTGRFLTLRHIFYQPVSDDYRISSKYLGREGYAKSVTKVRRHRMLSLIFVYSLRH